MINKVKKLIGVQDNLQDLVIETIIDNTQSYLSYLLGKEVPESLEFVVVEVSVMRYNRLGAEGMRSEWTEGHKTEFHAPGNDFYMYKEIIDMEKARESGSGKLVFL